VPDAAGRPSGVGVLRRRGSTENVAPWSELEDTDELDAAAKSLRVKRTRTRKL
jgi:hypothetical protein